MKLTLDNGKTVDITLEKSKEGGRIAIKADDYYILQITTTGELYRTHFVDPDLGLSLDSKDRIKETFRGQETKNDR